MNDGQGKVGEEKKEMESIPGWVKLLGYLSCFVIGGFYFKKIMVQNDEEMVESEIGPSESYDIEPKISENMKKNE